MENIDVEKMTDAELMRIRKAAFRATRVYPGPVGQLISRELFEWSDFGWRLGGKCLVIELVDHVMSAVEESEAAA